MAGKLSAQPFTTYSPKQLLQDHSKNQVSSLMCWAGLPLPWNKDGLGIDIGEKLRGTDLLKKRSRILAVIKSIAFCGRQCIALRGHHLEVYTSGSGNRLVRKRRRADIRVGDKKTGNLLSLLQFKREAGDVSVDDVINNRAKFSSAIIKKEILNITEQTIITDIRENMLKKEPFTVIADETTRGVL